jgi:hypothetical protein
MMLTHWGGWEGWKMVQGKSQKAEISDASGAPVVSGAPATIIFPEGDGFGAEAAKETAVRMILIRGREQAIERCNASIAKGDLAPGGAEFWRTVLSHVEAL